MYCAETLEFIYLSQHLNCYYLAKLYPKFQMKILKHVISHVITVTNGYGRLTRDPHARRKKQSRSCEWGNLGNTRAG